MISRRIAVGVVGASTRGRWGGRAHLPVFSQLPETEVVAICTAHRETAEEAARQFGVAHVFTNPIDMLHAANLDLVSICVRGELHHSIAMEAIRAKKHVFCEWPLAVGSAQGQEMAQLAEENRVKTCVGLQARCSPDILHLKDVIANGLIGKPLVFSMSYLQPMALAGRTTSMLYLMKQDGGGSDLLIAMGHSLDILEFTLGPVVALCGRTATQVKRAVLKDTGIAVDVTSADNVVAALELENGLVGCVQTSRTVRPSEGWRFLVAGTEGKLIATSPAMPQMSRIDIKLYGRRSETPETLVAPESYRWVSELPMDHPGFNTAQLVRRFVQGIQADQKVTPDFAHGVRLHKLLEGVEASPANGWVQVGQLAV